MRILLTFGIVILVAGCGITAPHDTLGYADLGGLGLRDVNRQTTVSIGPTVLRFAAMHVDDDPDARAILRGLEGVQVRVYEVDGDAHRVAQKLKNISLHLQDSDWLPVATIHDGGEQVHMLLKMHRETIRGLTVLTADRDQAVLVNVIGELTPEMFNSREFGAAMASLDIDTDQHRLPAK